MITLEPSSNEKEVPYNDDYKTEFEVQAYIYNSLCELGLVVKGEVVYETSRRKTKDKTRGEKCRFDLVIYENRKAIRIIEVKARQVSHKNGLEATRQSRKYRSFGVPVTFVYGIDDAIEFVRLMSKQNYSNDVNK